MGGTEFKWGGRAPLAPPLATAMRPAPAKFKPAPQEFEKFCPHPRTPNPLPPRTFLVSNPHLSENY